MTNLTKEERRAMAIWQLREWGMHPEWVSRFIREVGGLTRVEEAIQRHAEEREKNPRLEINDFYRRPPP